MPKSNSVPGTQLSKEELRQFGNFDDEELDDLLAPDDEEGDDDEQEESDSQEEGEDDGQEEEGADETGEDEDEEDSEDEGEDDSDDESDGDVDDKKKNWTVDDYKKSYDNLQKALGRQGQELGELRKKLKDMEATPPATSSNKEYTDADIPSMPDDVLNKFIDNYDAKFADPEYDFEAEADKRMWQVQYAKLVAESAARRNRPAPAQPAPAVDTHKYLAQYNLSPEDEAKVVSRAQKLSDNGSIDEASLEAAFISYYPAKYRERVTKESVERIRGAKTKAQPSLGTGNSGSPKGSSISIERLKNMDEDEAAALISRLPYDQVVKLRVQLSKK